MIAMVPLRAVFGVYIKPMEAEFGWSRSAVSGAAAVSLLKKQRPLVKKYWGLASDQIDLFKNGGSTIGASWPYQVNTLRAAKVPVVVFRDGAM